MEIRAILSDLGNVVVPFDHSKHAVALAPHIPSLSVDEIHHVLHGAHGQGVYEKFETGLMTAEDYYAETSIGLGTDIDAGLFWQIHNTSMFEINHELVGWWQDIKRDHEHIRLIAVTDIDPMRYFSIILQTGLVFDGAATSYNVGKRKPHADMFLAAIREAGVEPNECFYVDDLAINIAAAERLGIHSHHYKTNIELRDALIKLDLLPEDS